MINRRRQHEAAERARERRQRADDAPRLRELVPSVRSLRIEIEERRNGNRIAESSHVRLFVIEDAPALFLVRCSDAHCKDGEHDITHGVLAGLRRGATRFDGEDECPGYTGTAACTRVLCFSVIATYG
jgi:hypothetical protein